MKLEILICTLDRGIEKIINLLLPPMHNVSYLVSWQISNKEVDATIPLELQRDDVRISQIEGVGLSRNRNNALALAQGDICVIADDDVEYEPKYIERIIETFKSHPTIDFALFKYVSNVKLNHYPSYSFDLRKMPKGYYVTSYEITFRRTSVQGKIFFNELFGLGAPVLGAAEENIFINDALKKNLHCKFFPVEIVKHLHQSTGMRYDIADSAIMAKGAYIKITSPDFLFIKFVRNARHLAATSQVSFLHALRCLYAGARYAQANNLC